MVLAKEDKQMFESEYEYLVNDMYQAICVMEDASTVRIDWDCVPPSLRASAKTDLFDLFNRIDIPSHKAIRREDNEFVIEMDEFSLSVQTSIDSQLVLTFVPIAQKIIDGDWATVSDGTVE